MRFAGRLTQAALGVLLVFLPAAGRAQTPWTQRATPVAAIRAADFDCDGVGDEVVTSADRRAVILSLSSSAAPTRFQLADPISSLAPIDVDRDGDPDLVVLANPAKPAALHMPQVWVLRNQACGRFTVSYELPPTDRLSSSDHEPPGTPRLPVLPGTISSIGTMYMAVRRPVRAPHAAPRAELLGPRQSRAPPSCPPSV